jgi:O-antigen/teichoic acid export membrane protein
MGTNIISAADRGNAVGERGRFTTMSVNAGMPAPHLSRIAMPNTSINKPLSLTRNFSWTLIGTGLYAFCQWAMLVVLAKLCSTLMVGQFALALAITAPVFVFAGLNLRTVQVTDARRDFQFGDYLGLRLMSIAAALTFVFAIEIVSRHDVHLLMVVVMTAAAKALDLIGDALFGLQQQHERMDRIAISQMIRGGLQLLAVAAAAYVTRNVLWAVTGQAAVSLIVLLTFDLRNAGRLYQFPWPTRNPARYPTLVRLATLQFGIWRNIRALIRVSFPLGLVAMLSSLIPNIPRYFIKAKLGTAELAVYSAMAYIMYVGGIAAGSLCQAAAARLARYYVEDLRQFRRLLLQLISIAAANGVIGVLAAVLWGRQFLTIMYRPEYAMYPTVFAWLMAAAGVAYVATALGFGLAAARKFDIQLPVYTCAVLVVLAACILLVPRYGLLGAAWAFLAGILTWCTGFTLVLAFAMRSQRSELSPLEADARP